MDRPVFLAFQEVNFLPHILVKLDARRPFPRLDTIKTLLPDFQGVLRREARVLQCLHDERHLFKVRAHVLRSSLPFGKHGDAADFEFQRRDLAPVPLVLDHHAKVGNAVDVGNGRFDDPVGQVVKTGIFL